MHHSGAGFHKRPFTARAKLTPSFDFHQGGSAAELVVAATQRQECHNSRIRSAATYRIADGHFLSPRIHLDLRPNRAFARRRQSGWRSHH